MEETTTASQTAGTLNTGHSLIAEIDPPKGANLAGFLGKVLNIRGRVDAVRVTDSEHAIMRMSPIAPCLALKEKSVEPIMVVNGRDRNRISFQGDLLAAASLGVTNIVIKEGQDPAEGDQPVVRTSGDLDLTTMLNCVSALNQGKDLAGESLDGATSFNVGVALELSDDVNVNRERAGLFEQMEQYGVSSVTLGPTYDINIVEQFIPMAEKTGIKLYSSIMFLKSVAMVRYLNNLPGIPSVPQEFLKKMMKSPLKKDAGMQAAAELFRELQPLGDGTVLLAIGWGDRLPDFLDMIGR